MLKIDSNYVFLTKTEEAYILSDLKTNDSVLIDLDKPLLIGDTYVMGDITSNTKLTFASGAAVFTSLTSSSDVEFKVNVKSTGRIKARSIVSGAKMSTISFTATRNFVSHGSVACYGKFNVGKSCSIKNKLIAGGSVSVTENISVGVLLDARGGLSIGGKLKVFGEESKSYGRIAFNDIVFVLTDKHIYGMNKKQEMSIPLERDAILSESEIYTVSNALTNGDIEKLKQLVSLAQTIPVQIKEN